MTATVKVAVAQESVVVGDIAGNTRTAVNALERAARDRVDLVVFPECFLSGYMFDRREDALAASVTIDSDAIRDLVETCGRTGIHTVVGLLERAGESLYNSALLIGPDGVVGHYRKLHVLKLGVDRFIEPGNDVGPRVVSTPIGRIGLMICFDLRFPETARALALQGADLIAMPTAWPETATFLADLVTRVRALENVVVLVVADRADKESGTQFLGRSQVVNQVGTVLLDAGTRSGTFAADVDISLSRQKNLVYVPGEYEVQLFAARRPEHYGDLVALPLTKSLEDERDFDVRT